MRCSHCGAWTMAVFDFYGWSYICECGKVVHLDFQAESRNLDDPAESGEERAEVEEENVLRVYPTLKSLRR